MGGAGGIAVVEIVGLAELLNLLFCRSGNLLTAEVRCVSMKILLKWKATYFMYVAERLGGLQRPNLSL